MSRSQEEILTHQAREIEELNEAVIAQSRDIEALRRDIEVLRAKMQEIAEGGTTPTDRPPHY